MKQTERLYVIDRLLRDQGLVTFAHMLEQLEISPATLKRDLSFMRDRLNAPIVFDRDLGGYRLERHTIGPRHELPGLWFDDAELMALLSIHQMLEGLDVGGLLGPRLKPLVRRLQNLLGERFGSADQLNERVRFVRMHDRIVVPTDFSVVGHALLARKRLNISHYSRARDETTEREISPQRLVHYRNAWYLDAWCHQRDALRVFSLDATQSVAMSETEAIEVSAQELSESVEAGYGIFSGQQIQWAKLHFNAQATRWVNNESWHPQQKSTLKDDGSLIREIPYSDSTELEMDILRHGEHVTVLEPTDLVERIRVRLAKSLDNYS